MGTVRKCFAVDINNDPALIEKYKQFHKPGGPPQAVTDSIRADDIRVLEIYLVGDRMFMIMEQGDDFNEAEKAKRDAVNPDVKAWDEMMRSTYQKRLPFAPEGTTWIEMERIYSLDEQ
ncbi:L-rhamnose mutarotase [Martelella sp. HB161492]|uniref:L-rhamnose mutarotase n=1 Tax=Martelella sp. HB161492 TaxID=2720726 RepID=UPI0015916EA4|nr:L-rhamnose mutarotase [Martelella sp. HB161492]